MDPAGYTIIGTVVGVSLSGFISVINSVIQGKSKQFELLQQDRAAKRALAIEHRREKYKRYSTFLSAFWQEERYVSEMLEHLTAQRPGWSDEIRKINTSESHHKAIEMLNESMGWLCILCADPAIENDVLSLSASFDEMMECFSNQLQAAREGGSCNVASIAEKREGVRTAAKKLSEKLRADAVVVSRDSLCDA